MHADFSFEPAYAPRRFTTHAHWALASSRFKVHLISADCSVPPLAGRDDIVAAAQLYCTSLTSAMEAEGQHFGLGFAVLHEGEAKANYWLLFNWWIAGGIQCQLLSRAMGEEPTRFAQVTRPYSACVWESVSIAHERDAWVRTVLNGQMNAEAYLNDRLADGLY
ncbi:hypothetical protein IFT84_04445 [Rhizobium sp. CFBP 8762]|uniref:hypothetical protein n=1 Tax=Rhizobium sp. CFBP 8762 TaxID=2775279 RepID=UPI001783005F|nr:hypothetical protein [Rhizobium sp. CFBP 8762]MBD8553766.1 hypothetical protein [Rhizobium sp. CFBP 8762]